MKPPLTKEGCKAVSFWSITTAIAICVILALLSIWDLGSFEFIRRIIFSLVTLLIGILFFSLVNFLFVVGGADEESAGPPRTLSAALKRAKLPAEDAPPPVS